MKRDRKRPIKDYIKIEPYSKEYIGFFVKKGRLSIDVKRLKKVESWILSEQIIESICKIPRNTPYFHPKKKERSDYYCNIFADSIADMLDEWRCNLLRISSTIKTPNGQQSSNHYVKSIEDKVINHREFSMAANIKDIEYARGSDWMLKMIYVPYIHYIGSRAEQLMVLVMGKANNDVDYFNRGKLESILKKNYNVDLNKISNYSEYDRLYSMWNFMKHSTVVAYKKIKKYGDTIEGKPYENGAYPSEYVNIDGEKIVDMIKSLGKFFDSFCNTVFNEDIEEVKWNYDDYFLEKFKEYIIRLDNPLDLNE